MATQARSSAPIVLYPACRLSRTRILMVIFVADRPILAHTMARWTFPRWIPMLSASNSRLHKCRSMRLIMVAWFLTQHSPLHQLHFQGHSTIPGHFYRRVMCLVGDVVACRTQRRACDRAPVINPFRCLHLLAQVRDYAAVNVRRTCAVERSSARLRALRVPQPRDTSPELSSGEETAGEFKVGELQSHPRRHAPRPAQRWDTSPQMTRTRKMQTMESGSMRT